MRTKMWLLRNAIVVPALACGMAAMAAAPEFPAGPAQPRSSAIVLVAHEGHDHGAAASDAAATEDHDAIKIVPAAQMPTVAVTLNPDEAGGWNLALDTGNFRFAPEHVDQEHVDGEGNAHVFVDGVEIARILEPAYHLGALLPGVHLLEVDLMTNDHQRYGSEDGRLSGDRFAISIEGQGQVFTPPKEVHAVRIEHGALVGGEDTIRASLGDTIVIGWTVDEPTELHLHGYDVEIEADPAIGTTMVFAATSYGRFPVERHGEGEATLLWIEVSP